jgi:hypothetical protein
VAPRFAIGAARSLSTVTGEGPLGSARRGSWIVAARKSHTEWPLGESDHRRTVFGLEDLQTKIVYDVGATEQASLTVVAGRSSIERDDPSADGLGDGSNRAALVSVGWRSFLGRRTVVRQQVSLVVHDYANHDRRQRKTSDGINQAAAYRVDLAHAVLGGVADMGLHVRRVHGTRHGTLVTGVDPRSAMQVPWAVDLRRSWVERSAYASLGWSPAAGLTIRPGVRVADSTLVERSAVDRWIEAEWTPDPRWLVRGSAAVVHQFADLDLARGWTGVPDLGPERARLLELGVSRRLSDAVHVSATVYDRRKRDGLRAPVVPWLAGGAATGGVPLRFENALTGSARGAELMLEARGPGGIAGWASYAYGAARHRDAGSGETFRADFDQRHLASVAASAPLPSGVRLGLTFRAGSAMPIPGDFAIRDGRLFVSERRNQARLPAYARLDVRAERTLLAGGRPLTMFAEVVNVLGRTNEGLTGGGVLRESGEVVGLVDRLFPRLFTAGVRVEF